jgi:hypothetical protein
MNSVAEICLNLSACIMKNVQWAHREFRLRHSVETVSSLCTSLKIYVANKQLLPFAYVEIHCEISEESYSKRMLTIQTHSTEWHESDYPGIRMVEAEIADMLAGEGQKKVYLPTLAFTTFYTTTNDPSRALRLIFPPIENKFDFKDVDRLDYESLAKDPVEELESAYKILLWVRRSTDEDTEN